MFWSAAELPIDTNRFIEDRDNDPKLFVETADPDRKTGSG